MFENYTELNFCYPCQNLTYCCKLLKNGEELCIWVCFSIEFVSVQVLVSGVLTQIKYHKQSSNWVR